MKALKSILIILFAGISISVKAQQEQKFNLPKITLPSPGIQNFMRYGEIPVDHSTGVPGINIPLYTVTSSQLSVPISISYHASGIKVQDRASVIGLGWVLNSGGFVTQTILGGTGSTPTDTNSTQFRSSRAAVAGNYTAMDNWVNLRYVSEFPGYKWMSDRFSYQLPGGESGVFRYDYNSGDLIKLPYTPTKILPKNINDVPPTGQRYVITDDKGTTYSFKNDCTANPRTCYISSMVSADKTDTIRFTYQTQQNEYYQPSWSSALQLSFDPYVDYPGGDISFIPNQSVNSSISPNYYTYERVPDSIITRSTIVTFSVAGDRQDMIGTGKLRVTGMSIYNRLNGQLIKSYTFNQDYFGSSTNNNQRLRLTSITGKSSDSVAVETHAFTYETPLNDNYELPPYPENLNSTPLYRFREDYWGYYNGTASYTMIPKQFVPEYIPPETRVGAPVYITVLSTNSTNRDPDSTYAKAAMLKEIIYPTGGKTVFDFEPNRAASAYAYPSGFTVPDIVGGFRIRAIKNYLADGTLATNKYYRYGPGKTQSIRHDLFNEVHRNMVVTADWVGDGNAMITYPSTVITSNSFLPLVCDNGPPVFYESVTEYIGGENVNVGKTIYNYEIPPDIVNPNAGYDAPWEQGPYFYDAGNYVPKLASKKAYKHISSSLYTPVSETHTSYTNYLDSTSYSMGMKTIQLTNYPGNSYSYDYPYTFIMNQSLYDAPYGQDGGQGAPYYLVVVDVTGTQKVSLPTQTTETTYNPADSTKYVAKTNNITYGSLAGYILGSATHIEPTQTSAQESNGDTFITQLQYPQNYSTITPYDTLLRRNVLTPVIKQLNYKNNTTTGFLNLVKTNYGTYGSDPLKPIIAPDSIESQQGSGSLQTRILYHNYDDYGNVQTVFKKGGPPVSYIWGYKHIYPIAEATNALYKNIYYENFEEVGGNSTFNDSKTGHYSHTGTFSITLLGLDNGDYVLSYWLKSGGVWTLNSTTITVSTNTYTISLSSGQYDDIRFYPINSLMTTATYDPNIGQTSATDAKNNITYYEYDTYQRLVNIKDKDGNIVKHIDYNYAH